MAFENVTMLMGNLCKAPNLRFTPSGDKICDLLLAVDRGSNSSKADYLPVIVWGKDAEACDKYLSSGSLIYVRGRIQSRNYTDSNGEKHVAIEVVAKKIDFIDKIDTVEQKKK